MSCGHISSLYLLIPMCLFKNFIVSKQSMLTVNQKKTTFSVITIRTHVFKIKTCITSDKKTNAST